MVTRGESRGEPGATALAGAREFAPMSARRALVLGGIALIAAGMIFGDLFAVFVLHQNAARIGEALLGATRAVAEGNADAVRDHFRKMGEFLENRGTKVDTHVHVIDFGYLALLLALVQPYVAFSERAKRRLAGLLLAGSVLLPISVFLIHYVGLRYSPLETIGWPSILADSGGLLVVVICLAELWGVGRHLRAEERRTLEDALLKDRSWAAQALLAGGTLLVLVGFVHGAYYSAVELYAHERKDPELLGVMMDHAAAKNLTLARRAVEEYGALEGEKAVHIAAHSHVIEFGLLAILLAFIQPYVFLSERWKRRWVVLLLVGSVALPVCVLLELRWGVVAGGLADAGGSLVVIALLGMLAGVARYTGRLDAGVGAVR